MIIKRKHNKGFSLIEALVAAMILSASTITLGAICSKCIRNSVLSRQYYRAWELLDRQLMLIDYVGLDKFISNNKMRSVIQEENQNYIWEIQIEEYKIKGLYKVDITVKWPADSPKYTISAATMLNAELKQEQEN